MTFTVKITIIINRRTGEYMEKILLVEDDINIAKNLILLLEDEGFSIIHGKNQSEAFNLIESEEFNIALVDISLPDGSGFIVYTKIKEKENVPVIFLTAAGDETSVVTGLNLGADDYITKPFRPRELVARIKVALRKNKKTNNIFNINKLSVNISTGVVKKDNKEIFLSALEYRLLLIFINNPKNIITRSRLLDELWDVSGEFISDNALTVYIKRLREKIEEDPTNPKIILTVRGRGYRLGD